MPGYAADEQVKEKFTWPADTWLKLHAGRTVLLQIHTSFMPEDTRGLWRHDVLLPKHDRPTPVPCPGRSGENCPLCQYNLQKGRDDKGKFPFPSRRVGFAIGSIHGEWQKGKLIWFEQPEQGLIEKGPEFWNTLKALEDSVSTPDELEPDKALLLPDWTLWFIGLECTDSGVKAKAYAPSSQHPLWDMPADRVTYYLELYELRCKPWNDLDGLLQRVLTRQGKAQGTVQAQAAAVDAAGNGEVDDIDFDEEKPAAPAPAKPQITVSYGKPVEGLIGKVEAPAPPTDRPPTRGDWLSRLDRAYHLVYGDNYRLIVPKHLAKMGKKSPTDFTDQELADEIIRMETKSAKQQA